nr:TetR/AcrR family transcriptional regulator [Propionicimonas sp.]
MDARRRRPAAAREAIIRAATELIRVNGVAGTSISDVIAESGTSAGAIYHHFGSKERLVLEVARSAMAVPMTMIMQTSTGLSPAALFSAALDRVSEAEGIAEMLLQIWAGAKANEVLQTLLLGEVTTVKASIVQFMAGWCAEHAPGTDPEALASVIMGLITGYAVQRGLGIRIDAAAYRELGVRLLAAAVVPPAEV